VPLVGVAPYARRQELRAELRAHLLSMVAAYEELGSPPEEAIGQALRQFGDPRRLGRRWAREWKRTRADLPPLARKLLAVTSLSSLALIAGAMAGWVPDPFANNWVAPLMVPMMSVSAGLLACSLAGMQGLRRALYALSLLIPLTGVLAPLITNPTPPAWLGFAQLQFTFWVLGAAVGLLLGVWHDCREWSSGLRIAG
jgi:hypothetical protein